MSNIIVIGGGVVGIACALELQHDGHQVTILDPGAVGEGASWASCGSIAVSEVIPLSKPGTLLRAPGWIIDPVGPLTLRASSVLSILPWFLRFAANSRISRIQSISQELSSLTVSALDDLKTLLARYQQSDLIRKTPVIELYDSPEELKHERHFHNMRRDLGFQIEEISGQTAKEMEPSIASNFACATVLRDWRSVVDAKRFVVQLHQAYIENGGKILPLTATGLQTEGSKVTAVTTSSSESVSGDHFLVCAGAWSKKLVKDLGVNLQMEGVIGYQTSFSKPGVHVNHALTYAKGGFGITPYESGLAVAGSIEFAHLNSKPNWKRADNLVQKAKRVLPGLQTESAVRRMGRRPLTPDTKPIIGSISAFPNVVLATGHGQLGLTLCATTAKLVKDIIANRRSQIDLTPFKPDRF